MTANMTAKRWLASPYPSAAPGGTGVQCFSLRGSLPQLGIVQAPGRGSLPEEGRFPSFTFHPLEWYAKLLIMRTVDLIQRKRDGEQLAPEEIEFLVNGSTNGEIPDYQMSSFLMAVYFSGMTDREVSRLTECMLHSGETVDLASVPGIKVDKHSTGGVGDKTSF